MRDLEQIRQDLLAARAMQSLVNHNGFHELVGIWEKHHARLMVVIEGMNEWSPLKVGQWQGQMAVYKTLINIAKSPAEEIPKLEEELRYAEKSESIPRIVRPDVTPPKYGAT